MTFTKDQQDLVTCYLDQFVHQMKTFNIKYVDVLCTYIWYCFWGLKSEPCTCWHALYHLSHAFSSFCFSYFSDKVSLLAQGWPQTVVLLPTPLA
jgi:hypothetical protein